MKLDIQIIPVSDLDRPNQFTPLGSAAPVT